jgi:hypothetical protein
MLFASTAVCVTMAVVPVTIVTLTFVPPLVRVGVNDVDVVVPPVFVTPAIWVVHTHTLPL